MEPKGFGTEDNPNILSMNSMAEVLAGVVEGNNDGRRLIFSWNDDVLMEILLWLPAKSVIRFKSVCKRWLSLFSSDKFCHLHTLRCPKLQKSLVLETPTSQFFYFDPFRNGENLMIPYCFSVPDHCIVSACNGLMLLQSRVNEPSFHVYNPTTKQLRKIRFMDTHGEDGDEAIILDIALAFDPSRSPHYKVVCIWSIIDVEVCPYDPHTYFIEVYDSESHTWKLSWGSFTLRRELPMISRGVYSNGSIYWDIDFELCYYNIAKNEFKTFSPPDYPPNRDEDLGGFAYDRLEESNGHLYQSRLVSNNKCQSIMLFELHVDDDRCWWLLKYNEVISQHQLTSPSPWSRPPQLRFIEGSCSLVYHMCGKISVYSFIDKSSEELVDLRSRPYYKEDGETGFDLVWYEFGECLAVV